jgi:polysaccharide export outer membrane protein
MLAVGRNVVRTGALSRTYKTLMLAMTLLVIAVLATSARAADAAAAPPMAAPRSDYIIGPGDMLNVFVWRNPELSTTVPVRPDGKISTPLVEDMVAVGKTPAQLARDVEKVLAEYVRSPTVNVIVATATSALSQIKVIGQVKVPQSVPYRDGLRVLDVILVAGGVTDFAAPNRAKVVRAAVNNGKQKEERVKLGDLLEKGDMKQNLLLGPGDALVIPQARF